MDSGLAPGETATRLAELKYTCSEQHYRTGVRQRDLKRAVDRRAGQLMEEYRSKADRMDRMLGEEEEGRGRIRRQLDTYGDLLTIVVGKFLEMSEDAHLLMAAMAESTVAKQARCYGQARLDKQVEKGVVQGEIRRQLSAFGNLRGSNDFSDVTLACEDGQEFEVHKVILAASSPFFQRLLERNTHPHPLIFMRGLKSEDLSAILDFLYCGEANVFQENLDSFFAIAEELKLKGLMGQSDVKDEKPQEFDPSTFPKQMRPQVAVQRQPAGFKSPQYD